MATQDINAVCHKRVIATRLAKPYHYRRNGTYYLRMRPQGSSESFSVSLRSNDKVAAMYVSKEIQQVLDGFHLTNPDASWEDIKDVLRCEAAIYQNMQVVPEFLRWHSELVQDHVKVLDEFAATMPLSFNQAATIHAAIALFKAVQRKFQGDPQALFGIIQALEADATAQAFLPSSSVRLPEDKSQVQRVTHEGSKHAPTTFRALADAYLLEHSGNVKSSTLKGLTSTLKALSEAYEACGVANVVDHTRADLVNVKAHLSATRTAATVNKILTTNTTVLTWASDNGLIPNNYSLRLKTRGASSDRKAFEEGQIDAVIETARNDSPEAYWACVLAAISGARQQEILQLLKEDIQFSEAGIAIDINENQPWKSVKNEGSKRVVPLVDCKWFSTESFKAFVEALPEGARLFPLTTFDRNLRNIVRDTVGDDKALVFHSFRHALAGRLQTHEVVSQTSSAILGHITESISFDVYGTVMGQEALRAALLKVLPKT